VPPPHGPERCRGWAAFRAVMITAARGALSQNATAGMGLLPLLHSHACVLMARFYGVHVSVNVSKHIWVAACVRSRVRCTVGSCTGVSLVYLCTCTRLLCRCGFAVFVYRCAGEQLGADLSAVLWTKDGCPAWHAALFAFSLVHVHPFLLQACQSWAPAIARLH
jgi:hypothetical protein